jgi:hypothetical protein
LLKAGDPQLLALLEPNRLADSSSQNNSLYSLSEKSNSPVKKYVAALPVDLRLATNIRVISERPFPFSDTSSNSNFSGLVAFDSSILDESYKLFTQADLSSVHLVICCLSRYFNSLFSLDS